MADPQPTRRDDDATLLGMVLLIAGWLEGKGRQVVVSIPERQP